MQKRHRLIFDPSQRYQDSRNLSPNPKVSKNNNGFSNHAQRFTTSYYLDVDNPFEVKFSPKIILIKTTLFDFRFTSNTREHIYV